MLPGETRLFYMIDHMLPGLDLYHEDPAQHLTTAGEELDGLGHHLSEV